MTLVSASEAIRAGTLTPIDLLEHCLARIDQLEDRVKAWVFVDREGARADAERLTAELKRGQRRGPLHGIPIGIKDIIDVFDWPTAAGSRLWAKSYARRDAPVVRKLRQAGTILLGKTVTTAYASFDPPVTRNPWDSTKTPGGSSSGSAAAVACGMCFGALATQTGGSITRPASFCGVCSIKPTFGRVSVEGVVPLAPSMDHVGAIAGCVEDLAILFEAISHPAEHHFYPEESPEVIVPLKGIFDEMASPEMRSSIEGLISAIRVHGSKICEVGAAVLPAGFADILTSHRTIMAVEAADFHETRLHHHPEDYSPRIRELIEEGLRTPAIAYRRARLHRDELRTELDAFFGNNIQLTPATLGPAPDAATTGDPAFNSPWSFTGHPTVSFPIGRSEDGMPLCVQLISSFEKEQSLLTTAARLERIVEKAGLFEKREVRRG